jgi:hypothetical protein
MSENAIGWEHSICPYILTSWPIEALLMFDTGIWMSHVRLKCWGRMRIELVTRMTKSKNPAKPRWMPAGLALQEGHLCLSLVHAVQK